MSSLGEVERRPVEEMIDATSGEMIHRTDTGRVALLLATIREYEIEYQKIKRWATEAILEHLDAQAKWTEHFGALTVSAPAPSPKHLDWDTNELLKLREHLPKERVDELLKPTVKYYPDTRGLQAAAKVGGEIAAIIERAEIRGSGSRSVTVKAS